MIMPYTLGQEVRFIVNSGEPIRGTVVRIIEQSSEIWVSRKNKPTYIATIIRANKGQIEII